MNNPPGSGQISSPVLLILRSISREMLLGIYLPAATQYSGSSLNIGLSKITCLANDPSEIGIIIPLADSQCPQLIFLLKNIWVGEFRLKRIIDV